MRCHDITCCGVGFSDGGEWLCAGDLAGGVWVMQGSKKEAVYKCSVICYTSDTEGTFHNTYQ